MTYYTDMKLSYKVRLYPRKGQYEALYAALQHSRILYNAALQERSDAYRLQKKSIGLYDQYNAIKTIRADTPEWARYGSVMQYWPLKKLDLAFQAFFRRNKLGLSGGYPTPRGMSKWKSFGYTNQQSWKIDVNRVYLQGIGRIRLRFHRKLTNTPVALTLTRDAGKWYAVFVCETEIATQHAKPDTHVGIDVGIRKLAVLSDGTEVANIRSGKKRSAALKRRHRALSRCVRGSKNRMRAKLRLQKQYKREADVRATHLHVETKKIAASYACVSVEKLQISNMVKSAKGTIDEPGTKVAQKAGLNKAILDSGMGRIASLLEYKCRRVGGEVIRVPARNTSQTCSSCKKKTKVKLKLSDERFVCKNCGLDICRDLNASINIDNAGVVIRDASRLAVMADLACKAQSVPHEIETETLPEMVFIHDIDPSYPQKQQAALNTAHDGKCPDHPNILMRC